MGYTTEFEGTLHLDRTLKPVHKAYLLKFSGTRRMKRNPLIANTLSDPVREAVGLPIGEEGAYFVEGLGFAGQDRDNSVTEGNYPPETQPGL